MRRMLCTWTLLMATIFLAGCGEDEKPAGPATIFVAKKIITMEADQPTATAVAVAGDRILAVGDLASVKAACGDREVSVDESFADKVVMPGFVDPHVHPYIGAILMPMEFLAPEDWTFIEKQSEGVVTPEAYLERLKALEASMEDPEEWLWVWGYHRSFHGEVYRPQLDEISKTRPIVQWHRSFHEIILNTAAIEALGITKEDVEGKPQASWENGHLYETGLLVVAPAIVPKLMEPTRWKGGLKMLLDNMSANGITTIADLAAYGFGDQELDLLMEVFDADDVPMRTFLVPQAAGPYHKHKGDAKKMAAEIRSWWSRGGERVKFINNVKLAADGAFFSQFMQLKDGYLDGHHGEWIMPPQDIMGAARPLWDEGFQIHVHVTGDLGVKAALDALDACMKANPREDHRFTLEHLGLCWPQQMERAGKLGACVSANPFYLHSMGEKYSEVGVGVLRAKHISRLGAVVRNGMRLALHSDCLMAPCDPLLLAWCAVNRLGLSGKVLGPDEKISVHEALEGITIDAAFVLRQDHELGSIKAGKKADFAILGADPYEVDPVALKDIDVWGVVFEGRKVPAPR